MGKIFVVLVVVVVVAVACKYVSFSGEVDNHGNNVGAGASASINTEKVVDDATTAGEYAGSLLGDLFATGLNTIENAFFPPSKGNRCRFYTELKKTNTGIG